MSYDIRNQPTPTALRTAENERLNFLTLRSKLNKEYEDSQFERKENERLNIEPAIPIYRSKDEQQADMTTQRQILKMNLSSVMANDQIQKFMGYTFKNPEYAVLTNEYWNEIEPLVNQFQPLNSAFLIEWLNRFFYTKQKVGKEIQNVVDPDKFGDLTDINTKAAQLTSATRTPLDPNQIKQAVREIMNRNYNFNINPYSSKLDNDIKDFYVQQQIISPTKSLSQKDWQTIYNKEIRGFNDRLGAYVPQVAFSYSGFKKGRELPGRVGAEEAAKFAAESESGTYVVPTPVEDKTAQEVPPQLSGIKPKKAAQSTQTEFETERGTEGLLKEGGTEESKRSGDPNPTETAIEDLVRTSKTYNEYYQKFKTKYSGKSWYLQESAANMIKGLAKTTSQARAAFRLLKEKEQPGSASATQEIFPGEMGLGFKFGRHYISKHALKKKS